MKLYLNVVCVKNVDYNLLYKDGSPYIHDNRDSLNPITIGKTYKVLYFVEDDYCINNDSYRDHIYPNEWFVTIEEYNRLKRLEKLNNILE